MLRGADVTLVSGPTALKVPLGVTYVPILSAHQLFEEVTGRSSSQDYIIKAAAVADYRPADISPEKIKKSDDDLSISLCRTEDTLQYLGDHKMPGQVLCGFAMETSKMEERARKKLVRKHLDLIAANNVKVEGAGFGTDTNVVTMITADKTIRLDKMTKEEVAVNLLNLMKEISGTA